MLSQFLTTWSINSAVMSFRNQEWQGLHNWVTIWPPKKKIWNTANGRCIRDEHTPPTTLTECIHQEQYCTDTYNQAKNNRIPSLANVNPLEQTIDNRETIGDVIDPGLYSFECEALSHKVFSSVHSNVDLFVQEPVGTAVMTRSTARPNK